MTDEISDDAALAILRRIQASVQNALDDGVDPELVLDAVAAGLQRAALDGRGFGTSPLSMSLTRAFISSVGPMGGSGPTEGTTTSAGSDAVPVAAPGVPSSGPEPAEAASS